MKTVLVTLGLSLAVLLMAVLAMAFRPIFVKKGKFGRFPNTHVGANPGLRKEGVKCVNEQDREAQKQENWKSDNK